MTDPMQQARALVEKWRAEAARLQGGHPYNDSENSIHALRLEWCADELAAILAAPSESASVGEEVLKDAVFAVVFDSAAVLAAVSDDDRRFVSVEAIGAVLDAVVRAARALPGDGKEG